MAAMDLVVVAWLTDVDLDITDLAQMVEQAGLESLFVPEHTHVPVVPRDLLNGPHHVHDPRLLEHVVILGGGRRRDVAVEARHRGMRGSTT